MLKIQLLRSKVDTYRYSERIKTEDEFITSQKRIRRKNKRLQWVDVSSPEFKLFVKSLRTNFQLVKKDQAWTICWGRVPYNKKQKHMDHWKYMVDAEYFKDAKSFLILCKTYNMIEGSSVALFETEVPDTVYEWERDNSVVNNRFFSSDISASKKLEIVTPIKHSTLLRTDVSSERLIDENTNLKFHIASQWEKIKESLMKNDEILHDVVKRLKSIIDKNDIQKRKLICMENMWLHIHSSIESKSMMHESNDAQASIKIDNGKCQSKSKVPWRDFGIVYDSEEKQFLHKRKVQKIKI